MRGKSVVFGRRRAAIQQENLAIDDAVRVVTKNPAHILKLSGKGQLHAGFDADVLLLDVQLQPDTFWSRGRCLMANKQMIR